jgi:glyoxylase-like metal-dependent hydrolase (beta-lactamase superfamily II)
MNVLHLLKMRPAATGEIGDTGITIVRNRRNCIFFIKTNAGHALIDGGSVLHEIEERIALLGISPESVHDVFLTHSDTDHTAALPMFTQAAVHISEDEVQMLDGTTKRMALRRNRLPRGIAPSTLSTLADGQSMSVGGRTVLCFKAPGHTPGSMVFLVDASYFFAGDAFCVRAGAMRVHPFSMDAGKAQESIGRLRGILKGTELVLTSHYGFFPAKMLL